MFEENKIDPSGWRTEYSPDIRDQRIINWVRTWFDDILKKQIDFSETLVVRSDGHLSNNETLDSNGLPFLSSIGLQTKFGGEKIVEFRSYTLEEFYQVLRVLQEKLPEFEFTVQEDPKERKWIRYTVKRKSIPVLEK
jgi:hypothetical protein